MADDASIEAEAPHPWVSRGGVKLAAALDAFGLDPSGLVCLDVGASTGGFTDVLLARGARRSSRSTSAADSSTPRLAADSARHSLEGLDARALTPERLGERPDAIVIDVSFISQRLVLPSVLELAADRAWLVSLVKPQFEVGRADMVKGRCRSQPPSSAPARTCAPASRRRAGPFSA